MGKLVVFWSPWHGQAKVTASMGAIASTLHHQTKESIVMTHTQFGMADLEGSFDARRNLQNRKTLYHGVGLHALILNFKQTVLTKESIERCVIPLAERDFYLLPGTEQPMDLVQNANTEEIIETILIRFVVPMYDWTFVDLASGKNSLSERLMEQADIIVVTLSQNVATWTSFFEQWENLAKSKKVFYVLGGHKKESKYTINNFQRMFHMFVSYQQCGVVPDCAGYMDAISEGTASAFFLSNEYVKQGQENFEFIQKCRQTAQKIWKKAKEAV